MHNNQKERLIQQICIVLGMSQPAISTTLHYYRQFINVTLSDQQYTDKYANQVIVCSCTFLAAKIFEEQLKIRDILNATYSLIKLYQMGSQQQNNGYIKLAPLLINSNKNELQDILQPSYQLTMYNKLKKQILQAQQFLLRIIGFNFEQSTSQSCNFKQLLVVCDKLRFNRRIIQIAINTYNDLILAHSSVNIVIWIPGILYFSALTYSVNLQMKPQSPSIIKSEEAPEQSQNQQNQQFSMNCIHWQSLFLISMKKLEIYSEKIISYYEKLSEEESIEQESQ